MDVLFRDRLDVGMVHNFSSNNGSNYFNLDMQRDRAMEHQRRKDFEKRKEVQETEVMWLLIRSDLIVASFAIAVFAVICYAI